MAPAVPTWLPDMEIPLPCEVSRDAIEPTIVTSSPSRIHTVPRPITTSQWKRDHGSRSKRAGMAVLIVPVSSPLMVELVPDARAAEARMSSDEQNWVETD